MFLYKMPERPQSGRRPALIGVRALPASTDREDTGQTCNPYEQGEDPLTDREWIDALAAVAAHASARTAARTPADALAHTVGGDA